MLASRPSCRPDPRVSATSTAAKMYCHLGVGLRARKDGRHDQERHSGPATRVLLVCFRVSCHEHLQQGAFKVGLVVDGARSARTRQVWGVGITEGCD